MKFMCIICKAGIDPGGHRLDPCSLMVTANVDQPRKEQREQTFFAHIECIRGVVAHDGYMYILDEGFGRIDEADDPQG